MKLASITVLFVVIGQWTRLEQDSLTIVNYMKTVGPVPMSVFLPSSRMTMLVIIVADMCREISHFVLAIVSKQILIILKMFFEI